MTFFHFINCLALTYSPYVITYRFSGLVELGAYWRCLRAGGAYFITQLVKMLLLATFFPLSELDENNHLVESIKCTVDLVDLLGLYLVLSKFLGKGERKILVTAVGWGLSEALATRLLPLWFGARGTEFDWKYIQSSFECNINLIFLFSTCTFLWLWSRHDVVKLPILAALLLFTCYRPLLFNMLSSLLGAWEILLIKGLIAAIFGGVAVMLHSTNSR